MHHNKWFRVQLAAGQAVSVQSIIIAAVIVSADITLAKYFTRLLRASRSETAAHLQRKMWSLGLSIMKIELVFFVDNFYVLPKNVMFVSGGLLKNHKFLSLTSCV
jgi:hypothetical protein